MQLTVRTLKGGHFQINAHPNDTIMEVKKSIEIVQGKDNYPRGQQLLIHNGEVLKDESTLAENKVSEDGFLVVMLSKVKNLGSNVPTSSQPPSTLAPPRNPTPTPEAQPFIPSESKSIGSASVAPPANDPVDPYAGNSPEQIVQQLIDMGGGNWDRETVTRALRAAYNNPEQAVDYLYSGIPESADVAVPLARSTGTTSDAGLGSLGLLRNNPQFQALRSLVHSNPQILQPMLQELGKSNPSLLRLIQENHQGFLQLINEPVDDSDGDIFDQAEQDMPHAFSVTPAEQEAIERLEAMGFDRSLVIEAFLACDRNEELAVNYLLENSGHLED